MSMNTPTASAEALAEYLGRGGQPVPQPAAIGLNPGEVQYHMSPFTGYTYEGRDVSYRQISPLFISLRGCMMSILLLPLNLTLRGIASLRGAQRWRKTFGGTLYVTNQRLIANTGGGIRNFAYYDIA